MLETTTTICHRGSIMKFDIFNPIKYGNMIVINVPSLKYLSLVDFNGDSYLCENMPEVIEAIVKVVHKSPMKLLGSLPSVKNLYLCLTNSVVVKTNLCYLVIYYIYTVLLMFLVIVYAASTPNRDLSSCPFGAMSRLSRVVGSAYLDA